MPKRPISDEDFALRQAGEKMLMKHSRDRGDDVYCGCANPNVIEAHETPGEVAYFTLGTRARRQFRTNVAAAERATGKSFQVLTGCRLDCRPYQQGDIKLRNKLIDAWDTVSDDGTCSPAIHIKREFETDDEGAPAFDVVEGYGCPHFRSDVRPLIHRVSSTGFNRRIM